MRLGEVEEVDPHTLREHQRNWRVHPAKQLEILERLLGDLGQIGAIIASKWTRTVLNGHARLRIALETDQPSVLVQWVDVTQEEEDVVLASFDAVGAMRTTREDRLMKLMESDHVRRASAGIVLSGESVEMTKPRQFPVLTGDRPEPVPRNRAYYVYMLRDDRDDVHRWLQERLGDVEGVVMTDA